MNSLKKGGGVSLFNFVGGPGVPLSNFEGDPGVPLLNFEGVPGPGSQGLKVPGSGGPGPTFTPCPDSYHNNKGYSCQQKYKFHILLRKKNKSLIKILKRKCTIIDP